MSSAFTAEFEILSEKVLLPNQIRTWSRAAAWSDWSGAGPAGWGQGLSLASSFPSLLDPTILGPNELPFVSPSQTAHRL